MTRSNETLENLAKAFIGESQARNRYVFYAKEAKKDGYEQISSIFQITANNEEEHAKWLFRMINAIKQDDDPITTTDESPTILGDTISNLKAAIEGEHYENTEMYPEFARVARNEGLDEIADRLMAICEAEVHHEQRFQLLLNQVEAGTVFRKTEDVTWMCRKCGRTQISKEPPAKCPACNHPAKYFEIVCDTY